MIKIMKLDNPKKANEHMRIHLLFFLMFSSTNLLFAQTQKSDLSKMRVEKPRTSVRTYQKNIRGNCYYLSSSGKKVYVKKSYCQNEIERGELNTTPVWYPPKPQIQPIVDGKNAVEVSSIKASILPTKIRLGIEQKFYLSPCYAYNARGDIVSERSIPNPYSNLHFDVFSSVYNPPESHGLVEIKLDNQIHSLYIVGKKRGLVTLRCYPAVRIRDASLGGNGVFPMHIRRVFADIEVEVF